MLAVVIFCIGSVNCYAATSTGINVNYHSQKEIKDYLKSKKVNIDAETTYSKKASDVKPYQAGTISESSQKSALNTMNAIRYIAGIDAVGLDSSYTKMEQAAALVNSANGTLSIKTGRNGRPPLSTGGVRCIQWQSFLCKLEMRTRVSSGKSMDE